MDVKLWQFVYIYRYPQEDDNSYLSSYNTEAYSVVLIRDSCDLQWDGIARDRCPGRCMTQTTVCAPWLLKYTGYIENII